MRTGNNSRVSKISLYQIGTGELIQVAEHNPKFFDSTIMNNSSFITQDDSRRRLVSIGRAVHKTSSDPELVEGGQLLAMFIDPWIGAGGDNEVEPE